MGLPSMPIRPGVVGGVNVGKYSIHGVSGIYTPGLSGPGICDTVYALDQMTYETHVYMNYEIHLIMSKRAQRPEAAPFQRRNGPPTRPVGESVRLVETTRAKNGLGCPSMAVGSHSRGLLLRIQSVYSSGILGLSPELLGRTGKWSRLYQCHPFWCSLGVVG